MPAADGKEEPAEQVDGAECRSQATGDGSKRCRRTKRHQESAGYKLPKCQDQFGQATAKRKANKQQVQPNPDQAAEEGRTDKHEDDHEGQGDASHDASSGSQKWDTVLSKAVRDPTLADLWVFAEQWVKDDEKSSNPSRNF